MKETFCPVWAEIKTIQVPKGGRHEGFVGVEKAAALWRDRNKIKQLAWVGHFHASEG